MGPPEDGKATEDDLGAVARAAEGELIEIGQFS